MEEDVPGDCFPENVVLIHNAALEAGGPNIVISGQVLEQIPEGKNAISTAVDGDDSASTEDTVSIEALNFSENDS
jgi:hypothetical protein